MLQNVSCKSMHCVLAEKQDTKSEIWQGKHWAFFFFVLILSRKMICWGDQIMWILCDCVYTCSWCCRHHTYHWNRQIDSYPGSAEMEDKLVFLHAVSLLFNVASRGGREEGFISPYEAGGLESWRCDHHRKSFHCFDYQRWRCTLLFNQRIDTIQPTSSRI